MMGPRGRTGPRSEGGAGRLLQLVVGGCLVFLGFTLSSHKASQSIAALQTEVEELRVRIEGAASTVEGTANATLPVVTACSKVLERGCDRRGKYDLSHLTQPAEQDIGGPIQDDEALFLYSIVRGLRLERVLEVGGLHGYSAKNFLQAMEPVQGIMYTVDINPVASVDRDRHRTILKDARQLNATDVRGEHIDLVFFDCHIDQVQWDMYHNLVATGVITDRTILAFHDTNTHPTKMAPWSVETEQGWVHQAAERRMVNKFHELGWDAFMLHPRKERHNPKFPYRHGVVVMTKFEKLAVWDQY